MGLDEQYTDIYNSLRQLQDFFSKNATLPGTIPLLEEDHFQDRLALRVSNKLLR
jgi:hypothetical protein